MNELTLSQLMSCCPNLECVSMEDEGLQAVASSDYTEPLFHVVVTHKKTGHKTVVSNHLTEQQGDILRSKMTEYCWRTITVEPIA